MMQESVDSRKYEVGCCTPTSRSIVRHGTSPQTPHTSLVPAHSFAGSGGIFGPGQSETVRQRSLVIWLCAQRIAAQEAAQVQTRQEGDEEVVFFFLRETLRTDPNAIVRASMSCSGW